MLLRAAPAVRPDHPRSRWSVLVLLSASLLLIALDATILYTAVPKLTAALRPTSVELLWIIDAYSLVVAPLLVTFGTLGDRFGRRRLVLSGLVVFGVASAAAAFAPTPAALIAARSLLGVGGAMIMPSTLSILRQVFTDRRERAVALGVWSGVAAAGAALGPILGGLIVQTAHWGSVFLINIPVILIIFPVAVRLLPSSPVTRRPRWDTLSAGLSIIGILGLAYGIKELASSPAALAAIVIGAALLVWFVLRQRRLETPLLDIGLFANRTFATGVACVMLALFGLVGLQMLLSQYLQLVNEDSPVTAGFRMLPLMLAAVAGGLLGARLLAVFGIRRVLPGGLLLTAVALVPTLSFGTEPHPWLLGISFLGIGFGVELALLAASDVIMAAVPEERAGGAAAIEETAYELGAGLGVAVLGTIMSVVYSPLVRAVPGMSPEAMSDARESLASAARVARDSTSAESAELLSVARNAFMTALHSTVLVSIGLLALTAALAVVFLPRPVSDPHSPGHRADRVGSGIN